MWSLNNYSDIRATVARSMWFKSKIKIHFRLFYFGNKYKPIRGCTSVLTSSRLSLRATWRVLLKSIFDTFPLRRLNSEWTPPSTQRCEACCCGRDLITCALVKSSGANPSTPSSRHSYWSPHALPLAPTPAFPVYRAFFSVTGWIRGGHRVMCCSSGPAPNPVQPSSPRRVPSVIESSRNIHLKCSQKWRESYNLKPISDGIKMENGKRVFQTKIKVRSYVKRLTYLPSKCNNEWIEISF